MNKPRKIELPTGATPGPEDAAAIIGALERFAQDTAPPSAETGEAIDPWARVALLEGVTRESHADVPHPWINT